MPSNFVWNRGSSLQDLEAYLGRHAAAVLARKRPLTLAMRRRLHRGSASRRTSCSSKRAHAMVPPTVWPAERVCATSDVSFDDATGEHCHASMALLPALWALHNLLG